VLLRGHGLRAKIGALGLPHRRHFAAGQKKGRATSGKVRTAPVF
jgi:hypothetical protein